MRDQEAESRARGARPSEGTAVKQITRVRIDPMSLADIPCVRDIEQEAFAVERGRRGQRIGERLMLALIDRALERGARWMTLEVRPSNAVALALYRKFGFRDVALRKRYYSDNGEDAVVMWSGNLRETESQGCLEAARREFGS